MDRACCPIQCSGGQRKQRRRIPSSSNFKIASEHSSNKSWNQLKKPSSKKNLFSTLILWQNTPNEISWQKGPANYGIRIGLELKLWIPSRWTTVSSHHLERKQLEISRTSSVQLVHGFWYWPHTEDKKYLRHLRLPYIGSHHKGSKSTRGRSSYRFQV